MTERSDYELLDSGDARKLERFGPYVFVRPCAQAAWRPQLEPRDWKAADAEFTREGKMRWIDRGRVDDRWEVDIEGVRLELSRTEFGHLGVFPEQRDLWDWSRERLHGYPGDAAPRVLNLFAYSGGATLAAAQAGAEVCHVDASKGMVGWARRNAALNGLEEAPIRWIVDDAVKFLRREIRRERQYDAIILDPPTFGRGSRGEVYKIDRALQETLECCAALLSEAPSFVLLSSHTPGYTPIVLGNLLHDFVGEGEFDAGEMVLAGAPDVRPVPSGSWALWQPAGSVEEE